jgi:hypothetical protein
MSERRNNKRPRHDNRRDEKPEKSAADIAAQDAELLASKNPYMPMFLNFRAELDEHHDRRERVIKASRDVTAASKKMIFSLQRYVCVCSEVSRNLPACLPACLFEILHLHLTSWIHNLNPYAPSFSYPAFFLPTQSQSAAYLTSLSHLGAQSANFLLLLIVSSHIANTPLDAANSPPLSPLPSSPK